ncbi:MAG: glutamate racemase [Treponema sp.]|jgi:glutamate racemase|nr:glutamate racemase [Treponema sp.]
MDRRPVAFLDSGIGGIPYCRNFVSRNPGEPVVYLADHAHFPYGQRSREELQGILKGITEDLAVREDPKMLVLACNTATVSALSFLRDSFPRLIFVGTVPAVKPAVLNSMTRRIGVLGTRRTVDDPYIQELADRYGGGVRIFPVAAPELVEFVEYRYGGAGAEERRQAVLPYLAQFRNLGVDGVVLGCTHFLFLLKEFREEAAPDLRVYDSVEGITRRIESLLDGRGRAGGPGGGLAEAPSRPAEAPAGGGTAETPAGGGTAFRRFYVREGPQQGPPHGPLPPGGESPWPARAAEMGFELMKL